jgi:phytoene dehydrogenase-like protein
LLDTESGRKIDLTHYLDRFAFDLKAISPADATFIEDFIKAAKAFHHVDFMAPLSKPPELTHFWDTARMITSMWRTARYYTGRYALPMNQAVKDLRDPWLREVFEHLFLPEVPVWFVLFILGLLASKNIALRLDGSAGFARALEKRFMSLGGQITYRATVEDILVENDQAVGIRLFRGEEHRADRVVSASDGYSTLYRLLGGRYVSDTLREAHESWPLFNPVVVISYGVARSFPDDPWLVVLKSSRHPSSGHLVERWWPIRIFNYSPNFSPPDRTVVQVMADSAWEPWRQLHEDKEAYEAEKQKVAAQVLSGLSDVWPGIADQVDMTDVATPYTMWRYTLNREGAYEGFAITSKALNTKIYRTLPGLGNFYMAGQWTSPGGGVVPSLMTGRHAVMLLCKEDSKPFKTTMT